MSTETTIADKLEDLIEAKADMKAAIESKGVTVTGGLSTYADAIDNIANNEISKLHFDNNTCFTNSTITHMPAIDTTHWDTFHLTFYHLPNLKTIEPFDTSNAKTISDIFSSCKNLETVPLIDCSNIQTNTSGSGGYVCIRSCPKLKNIGGFKNAGKLPYWDTDIFINESLSPYITRESMLNIFNNLYDRASAGYTEIYPIYIRPEVLARLSADDIAIATNKGWKIIVSDK